MLGYVKIDRGELKVREYEIYCGYYCGVCKSIGRRYGQLPRMALSYDAAFLAIMLEALSDRPDAPVQEHCIGHHIKKKTIIRNEAIDYAADVMLILAWHKLLDDAHDENKIVAKAAAGLLKGIYKKLRTRHPALCEGIEEHLHELAVLEKEKCEKLDAAAEAFAKIMEIIFAKGAHIILGELDSASNETESRNCVLPSNASKADSPIHSTAASPANDSDHSGGSAISGGSASATSNPVHLANITEKGERRGSLIASNATGKHETTSESINPNTSNQYKAGNMVASASSIAPPTNNTERPAGGVPDVETEKQGAFLTIEETPTDIPPREALAKIGYHIGKWIYLADAIDDIEENIQSGAYNPLFFRFGYDAERETLEAFRKRIEEDLKFNLYHYLAMASNYMNPLDIKKNQGIIENIIYFGLNRKTEEIITRTEPKERI